ncbi:MAG: purine phosphoribosyltransferase family protein [Euryarchaeota archaeon TMED99]|nr:MAG: purine phosphoribosyltransferase family protein [Euryarchaeota archaeon TMED99]
MHRLRESLRNAPVIWKGDYPYFIHPITDGVPRLDPLVLKAVTDLCQTAIQWDDVDLILGIEAMGLPLTAPLSVRVGIPLIIARKRSYGLEGEVTIGQETGYSKGEMFLNDIKSGEKVVIVDDVLSTGGTLKAVLEGVRRTGAEVSHIIAVVEKGPGLAKLQAEYPEVIIESLVRLEMDGDRIILLDDA